MKLLRFRLSFLRERSRQFQDRGRAGRVVVGARMNFSFLAFPLHRAGLAETEVIVMRADHDVLGPLRWTGGREHSDDVAVVLLDVLHRGRDVGRDVRKSEAAFRMGILLVEPGLERFQIFARALKERVRHVAGDARGHDSRIGHAGIKRGGHELAFIWGVRSGDEQHGLRAMLARQHRLVTQPGVPVQLLPPLRIDLLRHVAQHERDLVLHIHPGVRIVTLGSLARHGQAVACKHDFAVHRLVLRERKRREIFLDLEPDRFALSVPAQDKFVLVRQHPHTRIEFKLLEKGVVVSARF